MKKLIVLVVVLLSPSIVYCFQDKVAIWSDMTMKFDTGDRIAISQDNFKIQSLSLTWNDKTIEIPEEDLQGISLPHLNTLYLSYSEFSFGDLKGVPYRVIHFRYGLEKEESFGEFPKASFTFYKSYYQERRIRRKDSPTSWQHEVKEKGKPIQDGGHEEIIK